MVRIYSKWLTLKISVEFLNQLREGKTWDLYQGGEYGEKENVRWPQDCITVISFETRKLFSFPQLNNFLLVLQFPPYKRPKSLGWVAFSFVHHIFDLVPPTLEPGFPLCPSWTLRSSQTELIFSLLVRVLEFCAFSSINSSSRKTFSFQFFRPGSNPCFQTQFKSHIISPSFAFWEDSSVPCCLLSFSFWVICLSGLSLSRF